tara:strand:- start:1406 stop:2269 length:864 start_codon:yes stop_codon:yes gene_type:complete
MATTNTFNPIDESAEAARKEAEAKALAEGERLVAAQEAAQEQTYEDARKADQESSRYAGKYKSAEELEKAYLELQKKLGERSTEETSTETETEEPSAEATEEEAEEESPEEHSEVYQALESASQEYEEGGELSPDTLEKLAQLDSKELVEQWVEYVNSSKGDPEPGAMPQEDVDRIMGSVGGTESYQQMIAWAGEALAPDEIAAYDAVVTSGDPNSVYWAVQGLRSKYVESNGFEGTQISGNRAARPEPGFRSQAELARAISDPRYRDDPAYRMDVEQKLARSGDLM